MYLLWALQRIIFNRLDKPENEAMADLSIRELLVLAPLIASILWIGLYPKPILDRIEASTVALVEQVDQGRRGVPAVELALRGEE